MNWVDELFEKRGKWESILRNRYGISSNGSNAFVTQILDDLVLAVLGEDQQIKEATSALSGQSRTEAQRSLRDSAFRDWVKKCEGLKKK